MNAELGSGATSALSEPEAARLSVVSQHALGWLVAANSVGVLLATLLLFPAAGDWLGALTYGRWMAVHTNWQLYGWCSLPLIEVLHAWWGKPPERCAHAEHTWLQVSTWTWSAGSRA
jgi:cytochrome c oxidase cbb3-type subunit 1